MKRPLFEKVEIHGVEDLPKENGFYISSCKTSIRSVQERTYYLDQKLSWIGYIDWYLQPIEQPAEKEQTITIPKWKMTAIEDVLRQANNIHHSQKKETCFDRCICKAWKFACDALNKEYSFEPIESQSSPAMSPKPTNDVIGFDVLKRNSDIAFDQTIKAVKESMSPKEITDEMISDYASDQVSKYLKARNNPVVDLHKRFVNTAKYFRSQMTANRREELINFLMWYSEKIYNSVTDGTPEEVVDNYLTGLNQKEEK